MSIINKLTGLYTREDVEEAVKSSKSEVKRLKGEIFFVRFLLAKAHLRDPKTGRMLKKGVIPKSSKNN